MILLSVGASPGALAIPAVASEIAGTGNRVEVILGQKARRFVGPAAFRDVALIDDPSQTPEAVLFAPAPVDTLANLARGMDSRFSASTVVVPDLDAGTAGHPAVRENVDLLREDGYRIVEGREGGMASTGEIVAGLLGSLGGPMSGLRLLVTAGGTREPIDSVRFIGNRSSGKMGLAVAREALRLGAGVTVVAANVATVEPGTRYHTVETVEELHGAVLDLAADSDALVMAAAVSDFTPASQVREKIRRSSGTTSLELAPTADILETVREQYPDLFVVGFAATHGDPVADAREKLAKKGANLVVGNDISREGVGFGAAENEVYVVGREKERFVPRASKEQVARVILDSMMAEMDEER
ncbi:MAG TPA: bifunctional phosphopantothenoylcysteine decarboxylase/phosphopantothenate--cysteine ligase CoaBC [Rubrobacter sp.]|nr:bifunctional phosphopantothenoylcysteine decarboxylase/phosphopantothenate--cysteine ligase CoaBC [Rubrobacter sp.]